MNGFAVFGIIVLLLVIIFCALYVVFIRVRAHRSGLPPPPLASYIHFNRQPALGYPAQPRSSGVIGWVHDKFSGFKNSRTAGGAYENTYAGAGGGGGRSNRGGFGPLDPDGAWDSRVGNEADAYGPVGDYEEQELDDHHPSSGPYGGSGYGGPATELPGYGTEEMTRGRSPYREPPHIIGGGQKGLDQRYDEEMGRSDPFGDHAEASTLRGISPRPVEMGSEGSKQTQNHGQKSSLGSVQGDSPTERRSMFHENM
ncbi:hypothetical protein MMC09_000152 [Bachmanniomyces sp. S44760]|nr:hypothetical protein [Bachmanniomyces sp. S44760]